MLAPNTLHDPILMTESDHFQSIPLNRETNLYYDKNREEVHK